MISYVGTVIAFEEVFSKDRPYEIVAIRLIYSDGRVLNVKAEMTYDYTPDDDGRGELIITAE